MMFANEGRQQVATFGVGPDARQGLGLFRELWSRVQGARTHPYGLEKSDPSITWNGVAQAPQNFRGLNAPMGGSVPYRNGGNATIASGLIEGPMGDPARRIFAQRLKRQSNVIGGS
jgi:hypothetical protein